MRPCKSEFGGVDIVDVSAGIMRPAPITVATDKDSTEQVEANIRGTVSAQRRAARRVRDGGRIVTLSSTALASNAPGYGVCNATHGGVEGFTGVLAEEEGSRRVTVNAVSPGPSETALFLAGKRTNDVVGLAGPAPPQRIGQPADIAGAVALPVSPDAGWRSGQVLPVNGGAA